MDALRLQAVAARVVAWHNRHPLARRITEAQVLAVGYVALPYCSAAAGAAAPPAAAPGAGGTLRERALARARQTDAGAAAAPLTAAPPAQLAAAPSADLRAAFSEDFIAPLAPRDVARWGARHGCVLAQPPVDAPLRAVPADPLPSGTQPVSVYLLTAAIEAGDARQRVLLGRGDVAAVLGRRLWSRPRAGGVAGLVLLLGVGCVLALRGAGGGGTAELAAAAPPAVAATAAASAAPMRAGAPERAAATAAAGATAAQLTAAVSAATLAAAASATRAAATPSAPAVSAVEPPAVAAADDPAAPAAGTAASAPAPGAHPQRAEPRPQFGRIAPTVLPALGDEAKAAARHSRQARQALAGAAATAGDAAAPGTAPAATVPPLAGTAFAVASRALRTRTEAEQLAVAMAALLGAPGAVGLRVAPAADSALRVGTPADSALRVGTSAGSALRVGTSAGSALRVGTSAGSTLRVEVLPQGDDWRVVGWPFAAQAQADKARALLVSRGMRVAVIRF